MRSGRRTGALLVGVLGVTTVLGLGTWGWSQGGGHGVADALYKALQAFVLGEAYADLAGNPARWALEVVRWVGTFMAFYAVVLLLWAALTSWRLTLRARTRRGHVLVAGAATFADRLSETASGGDLKLQVVQLRAPDQPQVARGRLIRLPRHGVGDDGLDEGGAGNARRLVIALHDDGAAVDLALAAQKRYPNLPIMARIDDGWLMRNLHDLPGGETLRAFSEAEAAAREIVRRHPLFLLADDRGQGRIHAALLGDHDWVEALLIEIILSSRVLKLAKPRLTLAVSDAEVLRRRFSARYPELDQEAELTFLTFDPAVLAFPDEPSADAAGLTAVYCAFEDGALSLKAALSLKRQARSWAGFSAPIFVRVCGDQGLERAVAGAALGALSIIPFGCMTDVIHAAGIVCETSDRAERAWHEAYLRLNPDSRAAVPWDRLNEDYRLSNRRAVGHVYAKLHEAGFDLRPWLATAKPWDELPSLAPGENLFRGETELMRLAELEHERWNADRRLLGWRYAPSKDEGLKHQPYLTDFAALSVEIQNYDVELVRSLDQILPRRPGGVRRRETA